MPTANPKYILSCYFDVSDVSFALVPFDTTQEIRFFNFPYTYSHEAFSNQIDDADFNKAIVESVLKANKIKSTEVEVIAAGLLDEPVLSYETKFSSKIVALMPEIKDFYPFIVNSFTVLTKDAVLSYERIREKGQQGMDDDEIDDFANLSIYPQLMPVDIPTIAVLDQDVASKASQLALGYKSGQNITFSGSRFSRNSTLGYLDWILALDLIKPAGFYHLFIDKKNVIPLFALLRKYKPELVLNEESHLTPLGTLINSPGDTECLLNSDIGTGQFFEVKKDSFFVVPAAKDTKESVSVKGHILGNQQRIITGGEAGLMIKTVDPSTSLYNNVKVFNNAVSQLSLCMHQS